MNLGPPLSLGRLLTAGPLSEGHEFPGVCSSRGLEATDPIGMSDSMPLV